jgi:hypothetical protein
MKLMKIVILLVGVVALLLGGLWLFQGLGLVHLEPILCVGDCAPVQGPSATWALVGGLVAAGGAFAIMYALKRRDGAPDARR